MNLIFGRPSLTKELITNGHHIMVSVGGGIFEQRSPICSTNCNDIFNMLSMEYLVVNFYTVKICNATLSDVFLNCVAIAGSSINS